LPRVELGRPLGPLPLQAQHLGGEVLQLRLLSLHLRLHRAGQAVHGSLHHGHGGVPLGGLLRLARGALGGALRLGAEPPQLLQLGALLGHALLGLLDALLRPGLQGGLLPLDALPQDRLRLAVAVLGPGPERRLLLPHLLAEGLLHPAADGLGRLLGRLGGAAHHLLPDERRRVQPLGLLLEV